MVKKQQKLAISIRKKFDKLSVQTLSTCAVELDENQSEGLGPPDWPI